MSCMSNLSIGCIEKTATKMKIDRDWLENEGGLWLVEKEELRLVARC